MKRTSKKRYFLFFVLALVVLPSVAFPLFSSNTVAIKNGVVGEASGPHRVGSYFFQDNYGSHDWVCDYAVRLIYADGNYRSKLTSWLYDQELYIKYERLDDSRVLKDASGLREWWTTDTARTVSGTIVPIYGTDSLKEKRWLFARRYARMLYWTGYPDREVVGKLLRIKRDERGLPPGEAVEKPLYRQWISDYPAQFHKPHGMRFEQDDNEKWVPEHLLGLHPERGFAPLYAQQAGFDALEFLNHREWVADGENPVERIGKYEAAASCIGGMSHFIADLSSPPHTTAGWTILQHSKWEQFVQTGLETLFNYNEWYGGGGPDKNIDIFDWFVEEGLSITPMLPYDAAVEMGEKTFTAVDTDKSIYLKPETANMLYADALKDTSPASMSWAEARAVELTRWAVYYVACAIVWVLDLAKGLEDRDTVNDRFYITIAEKDYCHKVAADEIRTWAFDRESNAIKMKYWITQRQAETFGMSMSVLTLSTMLLILPMMVGAISIANEAKVINPENETPANQKLWETGGRGKVKVS